MSNTIQAQTQQVIEWEYISNKVRQDPFNALELDAIITHESGETWVVPGFWKGAQVWKVRFSAPYPGKYKVLSKCSDENDINLDGIESMLSITAYSGNNLLYTYGALGINTKKNIFEHANGKPFFWLGDTWWMGLSKRLSWPKDFQLLTEDRVKKKFSVIQIVAGLYPDMDSFDERGENEAGCPWEKDYSSINPAYFDMADLRIKHLVDSGLIPCILGSWGYYLFPLGIDKMKQHWRYLIARWGAYPVLWSLAGETAMPYYLSEHKEEDHQKLKEGWTEIGHYIKQIDPYARLLTVHPTHIGRDQINDDSIMDFNMLQTGHSSCKSVKNSLRTLEKELDRKPKMPVVVAEVNYEGILNSNYAEIQRLTFWSSILSGANGFTYGANGLWQANQRDKPFGNSPNGNNWGNTPWEDAYKLAGSRQLGLAAKLLQKYEWWNFTLHPEWVSVKGEREELTVPLVTGIPGQVRIIYFFGTKFIWSSRPFKIIHLLYCYGLRSLWNRKPFKVLSLESDINYSAHFWNPRNAKKLDIGPVTINKYNEWQIPSSPDSDDWILILEALN